ncbi:MAG TPA: hypothetical protein VHS78_16805 [Candidatus Elarobacter sp.]|jgi:hypothetical protein|nr:hypothetical protein [Candidatus Elarobacter sp.]
MVQRALERSPIVRIGILAALCAALAAAPPGAAPQPVNGVDAVISAFGRVPIVALGVSHTDEDDEFAVAVVRDPRFARTVRNVVIECGNSLYQPVLDRYIAGDDVPLAQLQLVWRNTTQVFGPCNDPHHKDLLDAVRAVNRTLPADHRIRVLAGDPPIDWDKVHSRAEFLASSHRDDNITSVIETQVLAKRENALLFFGGLHVFHRHSEMAPFPTVTERLERAHPHSTYVFMTNNAASAELDRRFASWANPSAAALHGTWLGAMDANDFAADTRIRGKLVKPWPGLKIEDMADAYLYLGPAAARHENEGPPESDPAYTRELERRGKLLPRPGLALPAPAPTPASVPRTL